MLEAEILNEYRNVAVVGLSTNPERASYRVASYLSEQRLQYNSSQPQCAKDIGEDQLPQSEFNTGERGDSGYLPSFGRSATYY